MVSRKKQDHSESVLYGSIMDFMPPFVLYIDPIVHRAQFRKMRINDNQVKVLMLLHHVGKAAPGFITHHLNIQKGSLTGVLKSLRRKELIFREDVNGDERTYMVALTQSGHAFVDFHMKECEKKIGNLLKDMDEHDQRRVVEGLGILTGYLRALGDSNERS